MLKPIPEPDSESLPFWQACRDRRLLVQYCGDCKTPRFPPTHHCPSCRSSNSEWVESAGRGMVYSWIVIHHPVPREVYGDDVPYVVALVELDEKVRIATNIIGCDPADIRAGMPVSVAFEEVRDGVVLAKFRPDN
jgi:uncharacterized OB-fold protein